MVFHSNYVTLAKIENAQKIIDNIIHNKTMILQENVSMRMINKISNSYLCHLSVRRNLMFLAAQYLPLDPVVPEDRLNQCGLAGLSNQCNLHIKQQ